MGTIFTWYGHATIGLETAGMHLLIDPYFSGNPTATAKPTDVLADYILVTHGHGDHFLGDTVAIAKRTGATVISNAEICSWLGAKGIKTHAQHIGGGFHYPFGYLKLTLALHGSGLAGWQHGRQSSRLFAYDQFWQEDLLCRRYRSLWGYAPDW